MRAYWAFTKKEWIENVRTYRLFILLTVFFLLGIMNPITAKLMPEIFAKFNSDSMNITITEPTALDSWAQFYKNIPQMGLIVMVIMFSGTLVNECSKGTLINMVTKGLKRSTIVLSKFTVAASLWTLCLLISFVVSAYYTAYYWNLDDFNHILFAACCLWLFGIFLVSVLLLTGTVARSNYICLLLTGSVVVILFLINMIPTVQEYNPLRLCSNNLQLINGTMESSDFYKSILITGVTTVIALFGSIALFNKKGL